MEEVICRINHFLNKFVRDSLSPCADENAPIAVGKYSLNCEEIFGEVTDWALTYLECRKCPYELAVTVAKSVATSLSALALEKTTGNDNESLQDATTLYGETVKNIHSVCSSFLDQPNQIEMVASSFTKRFAASSFAIKNKRRKMEDRHVVLHDLNHMLDLKDMPPLSYYAVFDGHAGVEAASYAAAQLHINIVKHPAFLSDTVNAIKEAYKKTDEQVLERSKKQGIKSGCTVVSALIKEDTVFLAWLGDSQALLVKQGKPFTIMNPHKPDREDERKRIEDLGGYVYYYGTWRVNGNLAVSRALGDPDHKPCVSSEPDLHILQLDGTEDFLVLACDGIWDEMSPEAVSTALYQYLTDNSISDPTETIAAKLVHQSKLQGSDDNITTIVLFLRDIQSIVKDALKFSTIFSPVDNKGDNFQLITDCIQSENSAQSLSIAKPNILELNGGPAKKLNNVTDILNFPYAEERMSSDAFQVAGSNSVSCNTTDGSTFFSEQNASIINFAPEATALSELPTPPIDDMLASQQFGQFCATELHQGLDNITSGLNILNLQSGSQTLLNVETSKTDSFIDLPTGHSTEVEMEVDSSVSKEEIVAPEVSCKDIPDEAMGIASTVVTNAIETAVKCVSSNESSPIQPAQKLNPYAEPFVMKSFFVQEESKLAEGIHDPQSSLDKMEHDIDSASSEILSLKTVHQKIESETSDSLPKNQKENIVLSQSESASNINEETSALQSLSSNATLFSDEQNANNSEIQTLELLGIKETEVIKDSSFDVGALSEPNVNDTLDVKISDAAHPVEIQEASVKNELSSNQDDLESLIAASTLVEHNDKETPFEDKSTLLNKECITDSKTVGSSMNQETEVLTDTYAQISEVKTICNADELYEMPHSKEDNNKDSSILKEVEEKLLKTAETEISEHVEDLHTNVYLQSVPDGIPEAEGVTEDVDSDSEKDGGWSYMKGNTLASNKNAIDVKLPAAAKAEKSVDKKPLLQNIKKSTLDSKVKEKRITSVSVDKSKKAASDKKLLPDLKDIKDKSKLTKVTTFPSSTFKPNSEKATKVTSSRIKKDPATVNVKSAPTKTLRSTLQRNTVASAKTGTNLISSTVSRPKSAVTSTETKATSRIGSSVTSNKTNMSSLTRNIPNRPTSSSLASRSTPLCRPVSMLSKTNTLAAKTNPADTKPNSVDAKPNPLDTKSNHVDSKPNASESKPKLVSTIARKPMSSTVRKTNIKETKNSVNKQISAGKVNPLTSQMKKDIVTTSTPKTNLAGKRLVPFNDRLLAPKAASKPVTKGEMDKKDTTKKSIRDVNKNIASVKPSKEIKGSAKSASNISDKTKKSLNFAEVKGCDAADSCQATNVSEEEKFILETNIKETVSDQKNIPFEANNELCTLESDAVTKAPVSGVTPEAGYTSPNIM